MASSTIHLAIAKKFLEKKDYNREEFLKGALFPDTVKNKDITHYTDLNRGKDNISHLRGKVNLYSFLLAHNSLTDFERGWFVHLVADYLFFDECFTAQYLLTHSYEEFRRDLYFAYDSLNKYIANKYSISMEDYTVYPNEFYPGSFYQECIFTKDMIDEFILKASSFDIDSYIEKIKIAKKNIKPY